MNLIQNFFLFIKANKNVLFICREGRLHRRTHVVIPRDINVGINSMIPFSVLGPTRGNRQADLWEAMMNVSGGNRIRSLRYLSGKYNNFVLSKIHITVKLLSLNNYLVFFFFTVKK